MKGQEQVWVDREFKKRLKLIKAQMLINGVEVKNLGEITKEFINSDKFDDLILDITNKKRLPFRIDKRRLR